MQACMIGLCLYQWVCAHISSIGQVKGNQADIDQKCYDNLKKRKRSQTLQVIRERFVKVIGIELGHYGISLGGIRLFDFLYLDYVPSTILRIEDGLMSKTDKTTASIEVTSWERRETDKKEGNKICPYSVKYNEDN